jgi:hypothetical protein
LEEKKRWKKNKKVKKKKKECTMDYYCNPQCIGCGWTVNSLHPLAYYLIVIPNQFNIKKIKLTKIILEKNKKKTMWEKTLWQSTVICEESYNASLTYCNCNF